MGFQAFVNIDEDGFIFATVMTPGNEHEIKPLTRLLDGSEDMLFADSAYSSQKFGEWMDENDIKDRVQRKVYSKKNLLRMTAPTTSKSASKECASRRYPATRNDFRAWPDRVS